MSDMSDMSGVSGMPGTSDASAGAGAAGACVGADSLEHPADAAHWFARMHSGEATDADRQAFAAWRGADPRHERDYGRLARQWDAALAVPEERLRALAGRPPRNPRLAGGRAGAALPAAAMSRVPPRLPRRRAGLALAGACSLAAAAGLAGLWLGSARTAHAIEFATRPGERRRVGLADGSTLHLNADTRLVARLGEGERRVELERGEAFFEVRHDPSRPFVVDGGMGRVTVTGTRFNVRRDADALQVSVESGSVRLDSGRWWRPAGRRLAAGQQAVARADGTLGEVARVNVANLSAWRLGKVIFSDMPLADVVREMNRYLPRPARLAAPGLGGQRVSGVFSIDDPEAMIAALPAIAPVLVYRLQDGSIRVVAR